MPGDLAGPSPDCCSVPAVSRSCEAAPTPLEGGVSTGGWAGRLGCPWGRVWGVSLIGNLLGSLGLAWLIVQSGVLSHAPQSDLLFKSVAMKMSLSGWELFIRGICRTRRTTTIWR